MDIDKAPAPRTERRIVLMQLLRFGITGGGLTLAAALGYWLLAEFGGIAPSLSLSIVFIVFTLIGYVVHSVISFRDHGQRDRPLVRTLRYFAVSIAGFAANQGFVYGLVTILGGPVWWPVVPMVLVTPLITFTLHRQWVFN